MTFEVTSKYEITPDQCCGPCARAMLAGRQDYTPRSEREGIPSPGDPATCHRCGVRAIGAEPPE